MALVEDHDVIRAFAYHCLTPPRALRCVSMADSAEALLAQLPNAIAPQVLLLDIGLPTAR